ncbi:MAG: RES domain-containing protein [Acidimicrobiales bacterium]
MTSLYRVLPYLDTADDGEPGHPLYVPPSTGASRIDNPDVYDALYLGDEPVCAVAEAFGWAPRWNAGLLRDAPSLPGSVRTLVSYELGDDAGVCDLDDADRLAELGLRPSRVVTRDRTVTQAWARELFDADEFAGVRWWSYYNPDWGSVGLWSTAALSVTDVVVLTVDHPAFVAAAAEVIRIIE